MAGRVNDIALTIYRAKDAPIMSKAGILQQAVGDLLEVMADMAETLDRLDGREGGGDAETG